MLSELGELQESDEDMWGCAEVSFTIETREETSGELVTREYTFAHAPEWDKWTFVEFEEERTDDTKAISNRQWRRSRHVMWNESESPQISVPPEVEQQLEDLLDLEEMTIQ